MHQMADGCVGVGRTLYDVLSPEQLSELTRGWRRMECSRGDALIEQGVPSDYVYFVEDGVFRVDRLVEDGRSWLQAFRSAGDSLGETAALYGPEPRTARVRAHTECRVLVCRPSSFNQQLIRTETNENFLRYLLSRSRETEAVHGPGDPEVRMAGLIRPLVRHAQRLRGIDAKEVVISISRNHLSQGLRLGRDRTDRLVDTLSIGGYRQNGRLTVNLARWRETVSRLGLWH
ncbi:Crp/Fnr family transcriptional regulator [Kitasatospora sp. NPDC092948]|uniref:Crp/Fnr family transcriptional regulator n=1 Tax=Kitasatospora sp. NPDC092948 TaxID=3364088 RepID=UPI00382A6988